MPTVMDLMGAPNLSTLLSGSGVVALGGSVETRSLI
jgi:hypothetical protein